MSALIAGGRSSRANASSALRLQLPHVLSYRTSGALTRALVRFTSRYKAAENGWETALEGLKIAGCS
jgi:hypothetical protein